MNKMGIDLAIDEINAHGGVRHRPLQIVEQDDEGQGTKAAQVAADFVANRELVAVIGHVNSGAMVAAAHVVRRRAPRGRDDRDLARADRDLPLDVPRHFQRLGQRHRPGALRRPARPPPRRDHLREQQLWPWAGRLVPAGVRRRDRQHRPDPRGDEQPRAVRRLLRAAEGGHRLRRRHRRVRPNGPARGAAPGLAADFLGGDGWTGLVVDTALSNGVYVGAPFTSEDPRPEAQQFVRAFRQKYQQLPDGNAALAYDATRLVAAAIEAVGPDRRRIRDWLAGLDEKSAIHGVTGNISFQADGDPVGKSFVMTRIEKGVLTVAAQ